MDPSNTKWSTSASRNKPPSRPSTPLRPSSRTSIRDGQTITPKTGPTAFPLESLEPAFAEFADSMADLEANFMHLQLMHESLSRFNESFASFLYGMNMNAFCVDFPEAPISDSFKRAKQNEEHGQSTDHVSRPDFGDETFMTTDTSFVENPPSSRAPTKFATPAPNSGLIKRGGVENQPKVGRGGASLSSGLNKRGGGESQPKGGRAGAHLNSGLKRSRGGEYQPKGVRGGAF